MPLTPSDLADPASTQPTATASIIRRVATLTCELESLESQYSVDGSASANSLDLYSRVSSTVRRLLEAIGIETRKPKQLSIVQLMDVGPAILSLSDPSREDVSVFTQTMDALLPAPVAPLGSTVAVAVLVSACATALQGIAHLAH